MIWIEVFKTGNHTDGQGKTKNWTTEDLDKIIEKYNPTEHQAPLVLGHPKHDAPAYGWVAALKQEGGKLYAQFSKVSEKLKAWVKEGKYQKRSISLYPDFSLRHVGFLGAQPPAVKGLADFQFSDQQQTKGEEYMEFFEENKTAPQPPQEAEKEDVTEEEAAAKIADLESIIEAQKIEIANLTTALKEQESNEAEKDATEDEKEAEEEGNRSQNRGQNSAQTESEKALLAKIEEIATKLQALEKEKASNFAEGQSYFALKEQEMALDMGIQEGKILPAWKEQGLAEFMACLNEEEQSFTFAEGKATSLKDWFSDFLEGLGKHQLFECFDTGSRPVPLSKEEEAVKIGQEIAKTTGFSKA